MVPFLVSLFILCSLVQEMECNVSCLLIIGCVIDLTLSQPATPHLHVGIFKIKKKKVFCSLPENQKDRKSEGLPAVLLFFPCAPHPTPQSSP